MLNGRTYSRTVDNDYLAINGSTTAENGAFLRLHGKDYEDTPFAGVVLIRTQNGSAKRDLMLNPDGFLIWDGHVELTGMADSSNYILHSENNSSTVLAGGNGWFTGGSVIVNGNAYEQNGNGAVLMHPSTSETNDRWMRLNPDGTWTWSGQAVQLTSDQRLKQQITQIDDKLLDAWEDVDLVQFKYNDAVDQKGDTARLHTGYVVQQIDEACKSHNLDISKYGLYCHEEYPERTEEVTTENEDGTTSKETKVIEPAREHYSLRYTETLVVECAYLRREVSRLKQQNEDLEQRLKMLEQSVK